MTIKKEYNEGDACQEVDCKGKLEFMRAENCNCHISAPCVHCESMMLSCDVCGVIPELLDASGFT